MKTRVKLFTAALVGVLTIGATPAMTSADSGDRQQFFLSSPEGSTTTTVTAVGVFDGVGEDVVVDERFRAGRNGRFTFKSVDRFVFDEGRLFVTITGEGREEFDEGDCTGTGSGRATYKITGGTRTFDDARGSGRATFDFAFAGEQDENGECIDDPSTGVFFAKLTGNLELEGSVEM